ncbi:MAG: CvpA family protein [Geobacter sp.]|nr:CvpA family protein [Geobacter sp.]
MNLVDILIWLILAGFVYKGFNRGLVRQICSLAGFLLGGWAAIRYHLYLADVSRHLIHLPHYLATILSFLFIFLLTGLLFYLLGHILTMMFKVMLLGGVNRIGGVLLGFLEGAFIICMVLYIGTSRPVPDKFKGYMLRSKSAAPFLDAGKEIVAGWGGIPDLMKPVTVKGAGAAKE